MKTKQQLICQLQEIQKIERKCQFRNLGKEAITHFKVLKRYEGFTLLEIKIDTRKNTSNKGAYGRNKTPSCRGYGVF
jgi:23S rRNA-/tRNA-specific pseudouridylate synthase